jgi:hypothetical protein
MHSDRSAIMNSLHPAHLKKSNLSSLLGVVACSKIEFIMKFSGLENYVLIKIALLENYLRKTSFMCNSLNL